MSEPSNTLQVDAEQLRRLVESPWCGKCQLVVSPAGHFIAAECENHRCQPLWTREPGLRPEGLEWVGLCGRWTLEPNPIAVGNMAGQPVTRPFIHDRDAAALVGFPIACKMAEDIARLSRSEEMKAWAWKWMIYEALASENPTQALITLRHRFLDSLDQQEQQT